VKGITCQDTHWVEANLNFGIRQALLSDSTSIARVHVDSWRTAYGGIIDKDYLASLSYADRETMWSRAIANPTNYVLVAESVRTATLAKEIVGFASGGANRSKDTGYTGELFAIYILEECRGQGIGKMLVRSRIGAETCESELRFHARMGSC
jgi:ribosomal protein S18 acetylase RimI-like enzyme